MNENDVGKTEIENVESRPTHEMLLKQAEVLGFKENEELQDIRGHLLALSRIPQTEETEAQYYALMSQLKDNGIELADKIEPKNALSQTGLTIYITAALVESGHLGDAQDELDDALEDLAYKASENPELKTILDKLEEMYEKIKQEQEKQVSLPEANSHIEQNTELPPNLQEFIASILDVQDRFAKDSGQTNSSRVATFKSMDAKEFAKEFSPMFLAVFVPKDEAVYLPKVPSKFQFRQAFALGHELAHAGHEIALEKSESQSILDITDYHNFKEGLTSYLNEITLAEVPVENEIFAQRIKSVKGLKKFQGKSEKEIIMSEIEAMKHSFHDFAKKLVESLDGGQESLVAGWFSGDLTNFEKKISEKYGEEYLENLKNLKFINRKEYESKIT